MAGVFYFPLLGTPTAEGNLLSFFDAGTVTPLDVWTDSDLSIPWAQPIVFNATGNPDGPIYVSPSPAYKVVYTDANGVAVPGYPVDMVSPSTILNVTTTSITTLTDAQIKALPTTPITLIAAPTSGTRIKVLGASLQGSFAAGSYTNINASYAAMALYWLGDFTHWATSGLVNQTGYGSLNRFTNFFQNPTQITDLSPYLDAFVNGSTGIQWVVADNKTVASTNGLALAIKIDNNGSGNLTGGNAANTMKVTVYYAVESL